MKKLMIAAAIALAATMSQAVQFQWRIGATAVYDGAGSKAATTTATSAYLFNVKDYSQQALLTAFLDPTKTQADILAHSVGTGTLSSGKMSTYVDATKPADIGTTYPKEGSTGTFASAYFAIFQGDKVFLIDEVETTVKTSEGDKTQFTYTSYSTPSKSTFAEGTKTYSGTGWYQAAAVPEPTSGLLLLLGVAGLALRRRRA